MTSHQNILFIVIDQLRADVVFGDLGAHVKLPHLRALMADSVTFKRHFSVTNPCGPSRASILTGQYAMNHRSVHNGTPLRHDCPTLASGARKAGYLPLLFGYTDTAQDPRVFASNDPALRSYEHPMRGFDEALEMRFEQSYPWRADLIAKGYDLPDYKDFFVPVAARGMARRLDDPAFYSAGDSDTAFLTDACLTSLAARQGHPWFAHLTYIRPHPPLVAPAPYNRLYDPDTMPLPARLASPEAEAAVHPFLGPSLARNPAASMVSGFPDLLADDATVRTLRALYLGLATEVDHHIGRVIAFLKDSGQYDSTLLVVTSDHGEMLGDRHAWGKMSVYDAAYHAPLIIRDPRNPQAYGSEATRPTESIDITPTILEWIGQEVPPSMDGMALTPFLRGEQPEWRETSFSELDFGDPLVPTGWQTALGLGPGEANLSILRGKRYTLVHFNGGLPPLLFDHEGDGESRNIAADPAMAPVLLAMTQKLLNHRMTNADHTLATTMITEGGAVQGHRHGRDPGQGRGPGQGSGAGR